MKLADLDLNQMYTYADYLKWAFEERLELIKGRIFNMSAPATNHQRISRRILVEIDQHLKGKSCEVFDAPFDVRLPALSTEDNKIRNVFQPDICVVCDPSKIDEKGCIGAPDIVVEILSPANNKKELKFKYDVYEESGVKEYWIVDPREKSVQIFILVNGRFINSDGFLFEGDKITSPILPGFSLDIAELFDKL